MSAPCLEHVSLISVSELPCLSEYQTPQRPKTALNFRCSVFVSHNGQFDLDMKKNLWVKKCRHFGGSKVVLSGLYMRVVSISWDVPGNMRCMVIPPVTNFSCLSGNM